MRTLGAMLMCASTLSADLPLVIAHRGASGDVTENTVASFEAAWRQGADGIEGDFRLTHDGHVVCIHDADTQRVAGKKVVVADASLEELRAIELRSKPGEGSHRIPTFTDVLGTIPEKGILYLEVKSGVELLPVVRDDLERVGFPQRRITVISFHAEVIRVAQTVLPDSRRILLVSLKHDKQRRTWRPSPEQILKTLGDTKPDGVEFAAGDGADSALLSAMRDAGFEVHVWGVKSGDRARDYVRLGVGSITTDFPARIRAALEQESNPTR